MRSTKKKEFNCRLIQTTFTSRYRSPLIDRPLTICGESLALPTRSGQVKYPQALVDTGEYALPIQTEGQGVR